MEIDDGLNHSPSSEKEDAERCVRVISHLFILRHQYPIYKTHLRQNLLPLRNQSINLHSIFRLLLDTSVSFLNSFRIDEGKSVFVEGVTTFVERFRLKFVRSKTVT